MGLDKKKCPLGKLGENTIKKAYLILNNLLNSIKNNESHKIISKYSNEFYTLIPHDIGRQKMS